MKKNEKGFSAIDVFIVVLVISLIGVVGWFVYGRNSNKKITKTSETSQNAEEPDNQKVSDKSSSLLSITPYGGDNFELTVVSGWVKNSDDQSKISKTINGVSYYIGFQITEEDYLKLPAYATDEVLEAVTTAKGTKLHIVKISNQTGIAVSNCTPSAKTACSIYQNGKPLFIHVDTLGSGGPGGIDFAEKSIDELILDLKIIVSSLPF